MNSITVRVDALRTGDILLPDKETVEDVCLMPKHACVRVTLRKGRRKTVDEWWVGPNHLFEIVVKARGTP